MRFILLVIFLLPFSLAAQQTRTISGFVTDAQTGERLYSATIYNQQTGRGTLTNRFGFFSISLSEGNVALKVSFVGYEAQTRTIRLHADTTLNFALKSDNKLDEVVVRGSDTRQVFDNSDLGHVKLSAKTLAKLPSLMGEKDVLKSLMILPGVQQGNEGSAGIFVRGGSPDQNLILLDDVPLYNVSHLFGFVSVFTPEAINSIDFYKGGFPARYGGRLSSVVDLRMKDGNKYKHETSINLGIISSQFTTEGPIKKGESSYFFSFRRTLLDLIFKGVAKAAQKGQDEKVTPAYGFYDLNGKVNLKLNEHNQLYWSLYSGSDKLNIDYSNHIKTIDWEEIQKTSGTMNWGNLMTAFKLNSQLSPKLFLNTTLSGSIFNYGDLFSGSSTKKVSDNESTNAFSLKYQSRIRSIFLKSDCDIFGKSDHPLQAGIYLSANNYLPGKQKVVKNDQADAYSSGEIFSWDYGFYLDKKFDLGKRFSLSAGLRSSFNSIRNQKTYFALEPRLSVVFKTSENSSIQASFAKMTQPIHLLSNGNVGLPTNIWVPSTNRIRPETSNIYSVGFKQSIGQKLKFSTEAYYKTLDHVISFTEGDGILDVNQDWEQKIAEGKGRCWGVENDIRYSSSKLISWAGYTLAWNERKFEEINQGRWYPYQFDRRHKIDLGFIYKFNEYWSFTATWTYQSGAPATYSGLYYNGFPGNLNYNISDFFTGNTIDNSRIQYYPKINSIRLPAYHRMDIGLSKNWETYGRKNTLSISVYNVYSRQNPFLIFTKTKSDGTTGLKQFSLFPIIPAISYRVSF